MEGRMPDPNRLGGLAWTRRTGGALTGAERRRLLGAIARGQLEMVAGRAKLAAGRASRAATELPDPPDSAFARDVEEQAREQSPRVVAHSYRTWMFGHALAALDGQALDPELFWAASLLHDFGIDRPVSGQDFTIRSADKVLECAARHGVDGDPAADAVTVHPTPGIDPATDGALGVYVQAGALTDVGGLRVWDMASSLVAEVERRQPRGDSLAPLVRAEIRAVPRGRFALLVRCGFLLLMRLPQPR
jgi:hypothetical protein